MSSDMCEYCDGVVAPGPVGVRFTVFGQRILVQDVPGWVCTTCGESYVDAPVYKDLEAQVRVCNHGAADTRCPGRAGRGQQP